MNLILNRQMKIFSTLAFGLCVMSACKTTDLSSASVAGGGAGAGSLGSSTTPTPAASGATVDAAMYFKFDTSWDEDNTAITHWMPLSVDGVFPSSASISSCSIPIGGIAGTDAVPAVTHTCNFHIPEAQLYYSKVNFIYGSTDYVNCKYMRFYPYFYELNASNMPPLDGATPTPAPVAAPFVLGTVPLVSCYGYNGGGATPAFPMGVLVSEAHLIYTTPACFNGAGTSQADFPNTIGLISETQVTQEFTFPVDSARDLKKSSNRWISNDTADKTLAGASVAGEYKLSSMHGYTLQCLNEFGVLTYETSITITADHTTGPPAAIYKSWR